MDIQDLNQNPRLRQGSGGQASEIQLEPKLHPHTHKILWAVVGVLLLVVVVGTYFWWQEIKKTQNSEQITDNSPSTSSGQSAVPSDWKTYIANTYVNSEKISKGLEQYANAMEVYISSTTDKNIIYKNILEVFRAADCLDYIVGLEGSIKVRNDLDEQILNTEEKANAYVTANGKLSGTSFDLTDDAKSGCDFDPDKLPN